MLATSTATTETRIPIRDIVPLVNTIHTSYGRSIYNTFLGRNMETPNRTLVTMATVEYSTINNNNNNNNVNNDYDDLSSPTDRTLFTTNTARTSRGSSLPHGLYGIVNDDDFNEFCVTMNAYIQSYDAILVRRKKIVHDEKLVAVFFGWIISMITIGLAFQTVIKSKHSFTSLFLLFSFAFAMYWGVFILIDIFFFRHRMMRVIDEQNEVYRAVQTLCKDMSQQVTTLLTSVSPITNVTCLLGSIIHTDDIGRFHNMEYIKFKTTSTTINATEHTDIVGPWPLLDGAAQTDDHVPSSCVEIV